MSKLAIASALTAFISTAQAADIPMSSQDARLETIRTLIRSNDEFTQALGLRACFKGRDWNNPSIQSDGRAVLATVRSNDKFYQAVGLRMCS